MSPSANHYVEVWRIEPNPWREYVQIYIPPWTWLDQIMIDTISTNGPTANESSTWGAIKSLYR